MQSVESRLSYTPAQADTRLLSKKHIAAARRFLRAMAPALPAQLELPVAQAALIQAQQGDAAVPEALRSVLTANLDWVWPELQAAVHRPYGPPTYRMPAQPEHAAAAQVLVKKLNQFRGDPLANRVQQHQLRKALEALTGPPLPGHLLHLLELTRRRLQAYDILLAGETVLAEQAALKQQLLERAKRRKRLSPDPLVHRFENKLAALYEQEDVHAPLLLELAASFRAQATQAIADLQGEQGVLRALEQLRPVFVAGRPTCPWHEGKLQAREDALPPFDMLCLCALPTWHAPASGASAELTLWLFRRLVGLNAGHMPNIRLVVNAFELSKPLP